MTTSSSQLRVVIVVVAVVCKTFHSYQGNAKFSDLIDTNIILRKSNCLSGD